MKEVRNKKFLKWVMNHNPVWCYHKVKTKSTSNANYIAKVGVTESLGLKFHVCKEKLQRLNWI